MNTPTDSKAHPTPEQLFIRHALEQLTPKQRQVWELWNFERKTQDEIAVLLNVSQQAVSKHLKAIERRVKKWVKQNKQVYELLKKEYE